MFSAAAIRRFRVLPRAVPAAPTTPTTSSRYYQRPATTPSDWSYVYGASRVPLLHDTVGQRLRQAAEAVPDREVFIFKRDNVRKTYAELLKDARDLAQGLLHLGLKPGDRVGIWGPNHYEWVVAQFATALCGAILVNINPAYRSYELRFALEKVGVSILITPPEYKDSNYYRILTEIVPEMAAQRENIGILVSHDLPHLKHVVMFGADESSYRGAWKYSEIATAGGSTEAQLLDDIETKIRFDDPVNIQYTSGTTGNPKAATLSHHNIVNNAYFTGLRMHFEKERTIICVPPPLYHCFGCVIGTLNAVIHQQTCVFPAPKFSASAALEAIEEEKCTALYGTPTMFIDILNHPNRPHTKIDSLNAGIIAGSPCPVAMCDRLISELNLRNLAVGYGSTEISPLCTLSHLDETPHERIKSVGHVMEHVEVCVVNREGHLVKRGEKGEIMARGYSVMRGYWADEDRTREEITPDRWYHTGDIGTMNADGSVCVSGRSKDVVIRGGENIYPTEVEQFLFKHPAVADVQVIGVPDQRYGEELCAWIRLREDVKLTEEELREYCRGRIAHYKVPRYMLFKTEDEFPLTATGKVKKYKLRELSKKELGLENVQSHFND
ncbi:acyl-CoA synthetase family member 2 [Aphelenchoides avenae]|nr:acyl-CoA synthetase family member 2 [Aphelenchus avenae]